MKLQGIFIDCTTPFDHNGELYRVKIEHNIAKWNRTSVAGYIVGGSSGEGPLLSAQEKDELWTLAAQYTAPEKLLIAGVDAPGVRNAAAQVNCAAERGFAAALVETPLVNHQLYFRSIADRASIPILISNRLDLGLEALLALASHPNICGIVDHSGDCDRIQQLAPCSVLCGVERVLWNALRHGAAGAVLPFANAAPYATIALWEAFRTREEEAGLDWQSRITPAAELVNTQFGVPGLKHAMDINGYYGGPPRLPWTAPGPDQKLEIQDVFANLKS
jgi:Dihydrodipicolinate synthase/N-acetylneuraminate lyase